MRAAAAAGRAEGAEEDEGKGTDFEMGSRFLFFLDDPVPLHGEAAGGAAACCTSDAAMATFAMPTFGFEAAANAAAQPLNWDDLLAEPATWLETEPSDEEGEKLEDIDSYLLSVLSSEGEPESASAGEQHPDVKSEKAPEAVNEAQDVSEVEIVDDSDKDDSSIDDSSPEAVELQQLKYAVAQLDCQTRLSLKDGLYRLGENAARRETENSSCRLSTNTYETSTNSLDRAIARLLFHRPSAASSSCVLPGALNGHRPLPDSQTRAPPLHNHPCAGKVSNQTLPPFLVTQKSLPGAVTKRRLADFGDQKQRVAVSSTGKRIKLNKSSSLAV